MSAKTTFVAKAPWIMGKLLADFPISIEDAAAIVGNLGHECAGFTKLQEIKPVVKGSRGGWGWAQWTGPRRREYEAYCNRHNLNPASDKANYAFLFVELKGSEKRAIPAVKKGVNLDSKVVCFEQAFLRAGVKHYESRKQYARWALDAYWASVAKPAKPAPAPTPVPVSPPKDHVPAPAKPGIWASLFAAILDAFRKGA